MKNILILIIFIISLSRVYSQKYRPFDSTTVWGAEYAQKIQTNCYSLENIKYFMDGYELNNGNKWHKIFYNFTYNWHPASAGYCYSMSPALIPAIGTHVPLGYLYNDSVNKRVYFTTTLTANYVPPANKILYDFNKVLGDTMYYNNAYMPPNMYAKFKINAVDSILFSGKYHKRFLTTSNFIPGSITISFTEGIGSSIDPFSPIKSSFFESWSKLLCFASPTHSLSVTNHTTLTNGGCFNLIMSIDEKAKTGISIYPNPASDKIIITGEEFILGKSEYELINMIGQLKQKGELNESTNDIYLQNLSDGIYFINFYKEGSIISSKKIMIYKD